MAQASAEKLEHTGPAEKERVASITTERAVGKYVEPPLPKEKGTNPSVQSTKSCGRIESRWANLGEREKDQSGSMKGKGWTRP